MSTAKQLYELQEVDLEAEHKTEILTRVKEQLSDDSAVVVTRTELAEAKKRLTNLEHQQRTLEWEATDLGNKIAGVDKKLYEGSVKNPRELVSLQQDLELLKAQRRDRENQLLAIMIEAETAQHNVGLKSNELGALEREWREKQQQLLEEQTELESELATLRQKRELISSQIDSATLRFYEELRRAKQGQAVAKIARGRCQGCRISLPMSEQQRARTGQELVTCSNCSRILYLN